MTASDRIGFMQGRLSPQVGGMIQAFPWDHWRDEFASGQRIGFRRMEWTLDHDRIDENPLMTTSGRQEIQTLAQRHDLAVSSITGDCFMHAPFWKASGRTREALLRTAADVIRNGAAIGASLIVVPLVDNGALDTEVAQTALCDGALALSPVLQETGSRIAFESDFPPDRLATFITGFPAELFGVNLDIGNSASLGWDPEAEIRLLGERIINVHVKDRMRGGTTVPLGQGAAEFLTVFRTLRAVGYAGHCILQTARDAGGDDLGVAALYRQMTLDWIETA